MDQFVEVATKAAISILINFYCFYPIINDYILRHFNVNVYYKVILYKFLHHLSYTLGTLIT